MPDVLPLILREEPVNRGVFSRTKATKPNIAVVYADAFGEVAYFDEGRPMTWSEQTWSRYRTRYEVDRSDHRRTALLESSPLPAHGDMYFFHSMVDVGFRVHDPAAVVRRHVTDALAVVYNYLIDAFRPITRRHEINDAEGAENEINRIFEMPFALEEGVTIYRCRTRLLPDRAAQEYLRSLVAADRTLHVGKAEFNVTEAGARQQHQLEDMAQAHRLKAEDREYAALADRPLDLQGLLRAHLAKHPDQTAFALGLLAQYQQAAREQQDLNDQRSLDLVRYLIDHEIIEPVDIELLRTRTLGRVQEIASPARPQLTPASSWDDDLPSGPEPALRLTPEPAHSPTAVDREPAAATGSAILAYLVIDESPADPGYFEAIRSGLGALFADLPNHSRLAGSIRVAVLGYAADVRERMPLTVIQAGTAAPDLEPRAGARLGPVFDELYRRISDDVALNKGMGLAVVRPAVYLLCSASPDDQRVWQAPYLRIANRARFPYAPTLCVLGIGQIEAETVQELSSQPDTHGWMAEEETSLAEGARHYLEFVRQSVIASGQSYLSGKTASTAKPPGGFQPVYQSQSPR